MRVAGILVLVALLAAAALAAFAPASLADQALVRASAGRLRLANADGTLWRGAAELTDAVNAWRAPLRWRIAPLAWVTGSRELVLEPAAGADTPAGTIAIGKDGASLRDFRATVPASAFLSLASTRNAVTLGGNVTVTTSAFTWTGQRGEGSLAAQWRDARLVAAGVVVNLGVVDVALAPEGSRLAGRIRNGSNDGGIDVRIDGTVSVAGTTIDVDIAATPEPAAPREIAAALAALGPPDAAGAARIAWRGAFQ